MSDNFKDDFVYDEFDNRSYTKKLMCRGQNIKTEEWVYGYYVYLNDAHYIVSFDETALIDLPPEYAVTKLTRVWNASVCMYAFEHDVEDNIIFVDDVLQSVACDDSPFSPGLYARVLFFEGFGMGAIVVDPKDEGYRKIIEKSGLRYFKIIGNIHDSPDLSTWFPYISETES